MASGSPGRAGAGSGPRYQPLTLVLAAVATGIVSDRLLGLELRLWWSTAGASCLVWLVFRLRGWDRAASATILLAAAACGGTWHHLRWHCFADDDLGYFARADAEPVCLEAVVVGRPRTYPAPPLDSVRRIPSGARTHVELEVVALRDGADWIAASGRTRLIVAQSAPGIETGDRLRIFALFSATQPIANPGEFDFAEHARGDRRRSLVRAECPACMERVRPAAWWSPGRLLRRLRAAGDRLIAGSVHPEQSGLASAILLGSREEVTSEQTEAFMQTGTVHVLSISGMHVGLVAWVGWLLLRLVRMGRAASAVTVTAGVVLYTLVTDAEPPAVRAAILVAAAAAATCLGRTPLAFNTLSAAGLFVLALNPADLFRTGVQLSFLCVAGLMWFAPYLKPAEAEQDPLVELVRRSRPWVLRVLGWMGRWVRDLALTGAFVWLLTTPLVMARFHLLSPSALILNTVLWLPMTIAIIAGFGVLLLGWVPWVGAPCGWLCGSTIAVLQSAMDWTRQWPGSYLWVPGPADWWLIGLYGGLGVWATLPGLRRRPRWLVGLLLGWIGLALLPSALPREPRADCAFLSVGHGSAVVLQLPSGATMLYDAGQFGSPDAAVTSISGFLWSRGITRLDAVLLSHPDTDHYNALPGLLERFTVEAVYVPPRMFDDPSASLVALQQALAQSKIPIHEVFAGNLLQGGEDCRLEVLHPPPGGIEGSDNANSLVLSVTHHNHRLLLAGDLEPPGVEALTAQQPQHFEILLAPHHGSSRSRPELLGPWCSPAGVVTSGGRGRNDAAGAWRDQKWAADARQAPALFFHTGEQGAIGLAISENGWQIGPLYGP